MAQPPEPTDWTAESGVTCLGARRSQSGAWRILQTGEVAAAEAESGEKRNSGGGDPERFRGRCGMGILERMRAVEVHKERQLGVLGERVGSGCPEVAPIIAGLAGAWSSGRMI